MAEHGIEEIKKETRTYVLVFVALAALTIITVAVSYLNLSAGAAVTLAMLIALVKGSLVAGFFMHLISERKLIYAVLALTFVFFVAVMFLPMATYIDRVGG